MIDVHCHLTDESLIDDVEAIIKRALSSGIKAMITSGIGYEDCLRVLKLSKREEVYASLGIEPYDLDGYEEVVGLIKARKNEVIAVGEVGLDFYLGKKDDLKEQEYVFVQFIDLAKELDLPIVVHSRSAGKYAIETLIKMGAERVVMHAFDGRPSYAERGVKKGYYFSIPPSIVRSDQKQKLVKRIPLENLMLESDSPVLGPTKGMVNEPKNIIISAEWISRIKGVSLDKVIEVTTNNAEHLFNIKT